jgi:hypothetical protein
MKVVKNMKKGMKEYFTSKKEMAAHEKKESKKTERKEKKLGEKDYVKGKLVKHK